MFGALLCALVVIGAACTRPNSVQNQILPTPSPSPTPTTPLVLTASAPFHVGEVGIVYAPVTLSATGGVQPYTWTISAGSIPNGLTLSGDGSVSGTPTSAGNFTFTIQVADSGSSTATLPGQIGIAAALSASLIPACASQCSVELGCVDVCGPFGQVSGGVGPYTYAHTSGQLPAGTSVSGLALTGTFTGLSGYLQFSVQVTDSLGAVATIAPIFWMYEHISFTGGTCYYPYMPCKVGLPYSGGTPNATASLHVTGWTGGNCGYAAYVACPEPPVSATSGGGVVSITIGPMPPNSPYPHPIGTFTLTVSDQNVCTNTEHCTSGSVSLALVWTG